MKSKKAKKIHRKYIDKMLKYPHIFIEQCGEILNKYPQLKDIYYENLDSYKKHINQNMINRTIKHYTEDVKQY